MSYYDDDACGSCGSSICPNCYKCSSVECKCVCECGHRVSDHAPRDDMGDFGACDECDCKKWNEKEDDN